MQAHEIKSVFIKSLIIKRLTAPTAAPRLAGISPQDIVTPRRKEHLS
jgi:hypothetical protein